LTKWLEAKAMKDATATNVVKFIYEVIICKHGYPKIILLNRRTHFRNKLVEELCEKFKIKRKLSAPYHLQTNRLVERLIVHYVNLWQKYQKKKTNGMNI